MFDIVHADPFAADAVALAVEGSVQEPDALDRIVVEDELNGECVVGIDQGSDFFVTGGRFLRRASPGPLTHSDKPVRS